MTGIEHRRQTESLREKENNDDSKGRQGEHEGDEKGQMHGAVVLAVGLEGRCARIATAEDRCHGVCAPIVKGRQTAEPRAEGVERWNGGMVERRVEREAWSACVSETTRHSTGPIRRGALPGVHERLISVGLAV